MKNRGKRKRTKKEIENNKIETETAVGTKRIDYLQKSTCLGSCFYKILDQYIKSLVGWKIFFRTGKQTT